MGITGHNSHRFYMIYYIIGQQPQNIQNCTLNLILSGTLSQEIFYSGGAPLSGRNKHFNPAMPDYQNIRHAEPQLKTLNIQLKYFFPH